MKGRGETAGSATADAQFEAARTMMLGGGASMVYHFMCDEDIERIMRHPLVAVASDAGVEMGDGVPHPRGYGNKVRVLGSRPQRTSFRSRNDSQDDRFPRSSLVSPIAA